ncbi:hypothetical protein RCL1_004266 [Eukaryota sp. TZLM3-RCL]
MSLTNSLAILELAKSLHITPIFVGDTKQEHSASPSASKPSPSVMSYFSPHFTTILSKHLSNHCASLLSELILLDSDVSTNTFDSSILNKSVTGRIGPGSFFGSNLGLLYPNSSSSEHSSHVLFQINEPSSLSNSALLSYARVASSSKKECCLVFKNVDGKDDNLCLRFSSQ